MDFTDEQQKQIALSIRTLDRLQSDYDKSFETYDSAKVKGGFAAFISGILLLGVFTGNHEVQESIGTLGAGILPLVFIGAIIYFISARKKYHQKITEHLEAEQPLFDLGLSYTPIGRHFSERRLVVLKTREELNVSDFETMHVTKCSSQYVRDTSSFG